MCKWIMEHIELAEFHAGNSGCTFQWETSLPLALIQYNYQDWYSDKIRNIIRIFKGVLVISYRSGRTNLL